MSARARGAFKRFLFRETTAMRLLTQPAMQTIPSAAPAANARKQSHAPQISAIIPVYRESPATLSALIHQPIWRQVEQVVLCVFEQKRLDRLPSNFQWLECTRGGRAWQMNEGARAAKGDYLWFVHADSQIDSEAMEALKGACASEMIWGRFDLRLDDDRGIFRVIETLINWRSRFSAIATGDQALCIRQDWFWRIGGYSSIPLMEDIELCMRLKRLAKPWYLTGLTTAARRWRAGGVFKTIVLMWRLRLEYALGVPAHRLAPRYRRGNEG